MTLSNYTQNAQKYLDNTPIIRGINSTELVDLVLKYYDQLSVKYRKMISENGVHPCSARGIKLAFNRRTSASIDNLTYYMKMWNLQGW